MEISRTVFLIMFSTILVFSIGIISIQDVEAMKSKGTSIPIISSNQVCGTSLCDEPMSIQEKIRLYLQGMQRSESTILQQGALSQMGSVPLKSMPSTKMMEIPKLKIKSPEAAAVSPPPAPAPAPTTQPPTMTQPAQIAPKIAERAAAPPDVLHLM